jgi:hypothetical protein
VSDRVLIQKVERVGDIEQKTTIYDSSFPDGFEWINKKVLVKGEDFEYEAMCLCSFPKSSGKIRYIVEDHGRIFVQRKEQLTFLIHPIVNGHVLYINSDKDKPAGACDVNGVLSLGVCRVCGDYEAGLDNPCPGAPRPEPDQTIGEALEQTYKNSRMNNDDPLGR